MMKAQAIVAYYRVSTDRQGVRGLGMSAQRTAVEAYVQQSGRELIAEYCEAETGERKDRPQLQKAIVHARRAKAVLVIAKLDRLARNVAFVSALMDSDVEFIACDQPNANRLTLHILAAVAEDEAQRISERTKAALAEYKSRGGILGTHDPRCVLNRTEAGKLGQRKAAQLSRQRAAIADASVVGPIRELREEGRSLRAVAAELNRRGFVTRTGRDWSARQVQRVLDRAVG
jgi:DNA invertase Pin-like site-specific DNA recombinase